MSYFDARLMRVDRWLDESRETTNFTYDLEEASLKYLAAAVATVTGTSVAGVQQLMSEILNDQAFLADLAAAVHYAPDRVSKEADPVPRIARRVGWYALARITRPRVIVETGVDKGLGACVLCAALKKNESEGAPGRYFGTDIDPNAGWLLTPPYDRFGTILYGDSIQSLQQLEAQIDLFINDSDHSSEYERAEYEAVRTMLAPGSVILGDNAHCSTELFDFSVRTGRRFLYWQEWPKEHWYPGGGIGFSY